MSLLSEEVLTAPKQFKGALDADENTLNVLSLGAGVQSSTLAMMAKHGDIAPFDACLFADTGLEPSYVYDWLKWLTKQLPFPVYVVSAGNLKNDLLDKRERNAQGSKHFPAVPFFTSGGGMGRRQCTAEYKIRPIEKKIRELSGLKPRERAKKLLAYQAIGISLDEAHRMPTSRVRWVSLHYPLIDKRMSRSDCLLWMQDHGYPEPPKSACVICPYRNDQMWRTLRDEAPNDFAEAVAMDNEIRTRPGMTESQFIHKSLRSLDECNFKGDGQDDMFGNECSGLCNT